MLPGGGAITRSKVKLLVGTDTLGVATTVNRAPCIHCDPAGAVTLSVVVPPTGIGLGEKLAVTPDGKPITEKFSR